MSLQPLIEKGVEIEWKSWKLPIGATPPEKPEGYMEEVKVFLNELSDKTGLTLHSPVKKYDTLLAHIGLKYAKEIGKEKEYHNRVFQAVWVLNEDIEDLDVLSSMAEEVGLIKDEFKEALIKQSTIELVKKDFRYAGEHEVWTIPSYIGNNKVIQVHHVKDLPSIESLEEIL